MPPSVKTPHPEQQRWTYASLAVRDGERVLTPTHVGYESIRFAEPPHLSSRQVEITLTNGDRLQKHAAIILPHEPNATRIPIRLLPMDSD